MRGLVTLAACFVAGCCAGAVQSPPTGGGLRGEPTVEPSSREAAVAEVTALLTEFCERGVHTSPEHLPADGQILIVGTAGETMESREVLEQVTSSYESRGVQVRHDCRDVQRWVVASDDGSVVWAEEAIRTNARFPGIDVSFPSQRTLIFQRTPEGWRMRYYSLSVRLPDDNLDEVYGVGHQQPADTGAGEAEGGAEGAGSASPATE